MSDGGADAGSPRFVFGNQGLLVEVDPNDNAAGHTGGILFSDAGIVANFTVINVGSAAGTADVTVTGGQGGTYTTQQLAAGGGSESGSVALGRLAAGHYDVSATAGPTGTTDVHDSTSVANGVDVQDPAGGSNQPGGAPTNPTATANPAPSSAQGTNANYAVSGAPSGNPSGAAAPSATATPSVSGTPSPSSSPSQRQQGQQGQSRSQAPQTSRGPRQNDA